MGLSNIANYRIAQQLLRVSTAAQRIPALYRDAKALNVGDDIVFLVVRMNFILHQRRQGIHLRQKGFQFLHIPVGQAD